MPASQTMASFIGLPVLCRGIARYSAPSLRATRTCLATLAFLAFADLGLDCRRCLPLVAQAALQQAARGRGGSEQDDGVENIEAAKKLGMKAIIFKDNTQLLRKLETLGIN
mgnify:CR=1 FL=1